MTFLGPQLLPLHLWHTQTNPRTTCPCVREKTPNQPLKPQQARCLEKNPVRREGLEKWAVPSSRGPCPRRTAMSPGWARGRALITKSSTRLEANPVSPSTKRGCCFTCSQTRTRRDRISNTIVSFSPKEPGGERVCCVSEAAAQAPLLSQSWGELTSRLRETCLGGDKTGLTVTVHVTGLNEGRGGRWCEATLRPGGVGLPTASPHWRSAGRPGVWGSRTQ